ncbi:MAG: response regulator transcription factor [Chloroflexi bacterium]|nr:response regulator transcription factor [Chloroflexota bacterium]
MRRGHRERRKRRPGPQADRKSRPRRAPSRNRSGPASRPSCSRREHIAAGGVARWRRRREDPLAEPTEREREVLALIAEGLSNSAIAARIFVTERTVEAHVTQIFQKLELPQSADQHRRVLAVLAFLRA